jgi:radical S-adenosyl methionine domain-containing protein 2
MTGNNIVLSGLAGSGKSTIGKIISQKLGFEFISMGEYARKYAFENFRMNINEFQLYCSKTPGEDELLDKTFIQYCNSKENLVIDYRLGFHLLSNVFTILLTVSELEAAMRISYSGRQHEDAITIKYRNVQMVQRFQNKYKVNFNDPYNYEMVVNTDGLSPEEISEVIINNYKATN